MMKDTIFNRPRLLVIANQTFISRVPSLLLPMAKTGWDITIITPRLLAETIPSGIFILSFQFR